MCKYETRQAGKQQPVSIFCDLDVKRTVSDRRGVQCSFPAEGNERKSFTNEIHTAVWTQRGSMAFCTSSTSRFCPRLLPAADQRTTTRRQNARVITESICLCSEREGKRRALRLHLHQNSRKKKWVTTEVKPAEQQINKNDIFCRNQPALLLLLHNISSSSQTRFHQSFHQRYCSLIKNVK